MSLCRTLPLLAMLLTTGALAQDTEFSTFSSGNQQVHLLELFTSQGCSSCPPAEAWLSEFKHDPRLWRSVVPVAFHVDYWDGLGWRDRFADPAYSSRQRQYHRAGNLRSVYTPGFVISGSEWRGWFNRDQLPLPTTATGNLSATVQGNSFSASYTGGQPHSQLIGHVAILGFDLQTPVKAGENSRKTLDEDFVVLWHSSLSTSEGQWQIELPARKQFESSRLALAVWVHAPQSPTPLQATGGWF